MNITKYGEWIVKHPVWILVLSIIAVMIFASGVRNLVFTNDYRVFFSPDNPQLLAFEELQKTYTKNDNILIMLEPKSGDVFTPEVLTAVKDLTDEAWKIPNSIRVDSLTNFQHTRSDNDGLVIEELVEATTGLNARLLEQIRTTAMTEPDLLNRLLSTDGKVTAVNITISLPDELSDEDRLLPKDERDAIDPTVAMPLVVNHTRSLIMSLEQRY